MLDKEERASELVETTIHTTASGTVLRVADDNESVDLGDRYEILEPIGCGGMGTVYKVKDRQLDKTFAVKLLKPSLSLDQSAVKRFEIEAEAAASLTHTNIVAIYNHGQARDGAPYLVMDFVEGDSLSNVLKQEKQLTAVRATEIFIQIAEAVQHAHQKGVIHRDIKPSNILMQNENGSDSIKLLDFGIARVLPANPKEANPETQTGEVFGTPLYMSPEQCMGEHVDARSDIYSFGCLMYEALTGRNPFTAENPVKIIIKQLDERPEPFEIEFKNLGVPLELEQIIFRCLEKSPADRYESVSDLLIDLKGLISKPVYASVWRRVMASVIDGFILAMAGVLIGSWTSVPRLDLVKLTGLSHMQAGNIGLFLWFLIGPILLLSLCEASKSFATPGQLALKIRARDLNGSVLSFRRCLARQSAQTLTIVVCSFLFMRLTFALNWTESTPFVWLWLLEAITITAGSFLINASTLFTKPDYGPQLLFDRAFDRMLVRRQGPLFPAKGTAPKRQRVLYPKQLVACSIVSLIMAALPLTFYTCYRIIHPMTAQEKQEQAKRLAEVKQEEADELKYGKTTVVYSIRNIEAGEVISQDSLEERDISRNRVPADAHESVNAVAGSRAKSNIAAGDMVSKDAIAR